MTSFFYFVFLELLNMPISILNTSLTRIHPNFHHSCLFLFSRPNLLLPLYFWCSWKFSFYIYSRSFLWARVFSYVSSLQSFVPTCMDLHFPLPPFYHIFFFHVRGSSLRFRFFYTISSVSFIFVQYQTFLSIFSLTPCFILIFARLFSTNVHASSSFLAFRLFASLTSPFHSVYSIFQTCLCIFLYGVSVPWTLFYVGDPTNGYNFLSA